MAPSIRALFFFIVGLLLVGVIDARGLGANAAGGTTTRNSPRSAVKSVASAVLAQSAAAAREVADAPARAEGRRPERRADVSDAMAADLCGSFAAGACSCM